MADDNPVPSVGQADAENVVRTVMVAVDGSAASNAAVRYAADVCRRNDADLLVAHVVVGYSGLVPTPASGLETAAEEVLAEALVLARELMPSDRVRDHLLHGQRQAALLELSAEVELVVLGFQPKSTVERLVTGSTISALSAGARCPVVTVPETWSGNSAGVVALGIKTIETAEPMLDLALAIARKRGARLEILHSWHLPTTAYDAMAVADIDTEGWQEDMLAALQDYCGPVFARYPDVETRIQIVESHPALALAQLADRADLLLLARRARLFPRGHLGGTARAMLREGRCPVLVVPPPSDAQPDPLV